MKTNNQNKNFFQGLKNVFLFDKKGNGQPLESPITNHQSPITGVLRIGIWDRFINFMRDLGRGNQLRIALVGGGVFVSLGITAFPITNNNGTSNSTATIKNNWTSNSKLSASDLNNNFSSIIETIGNIPNWTKNGSDTYYTAGKVGIGTTSPGSKLEIYESGSSGVASLRISGGSAGVSELYFSQNNSNNAVPFIQAAHTNGSLAFGTLGQYRMYISNGGNVGIGTTSPSQTLTVNGNAGNTTGVWVNNSDQRLKKNIEPLSPFLDRLLTLRPVTFEWKNPKKLGATDGKHIGFIAQEVEKVFPNWVDTDREGFKWLNMEGANAAFVKALQELVEKDRARDKRLGELEEENKELACTRFSRHKLTS